MKIGIAGPIDVTAFKNFVSDGDQLQKGYSFPLTTELALAYRERGHHVSIFAEDSAITSSRSFEGDEVAIHVVPMRRSGRARAMDAFRAERRALVEAMRHESPDVIHAHWTYEFALAAQRSAIPCLITVHDWAPRILRLHHDFYRLARLAMQLRVLSRAKDLTAPSPVIACELERFKNAQVALVPNGVPRTWFDNVSEENRPTNRQLRVGCVAQGFTALKNVAELIEAFALVRAVRPTLELILVGRGYETDGPAHVWARERNLAGGLVFKGEISQPDLRQFLDSLSVLVVPSREESFGMIALEGAARGAPIIANARAAGLRFVLGDEGVSSWDGPQQLADLICDALTRPPSRQARLQSSDKVKSKFVIDAVVDRYLRLLEALDK